MFPTINGKELLDCNLDDIRIILNNPDFRESEFIDYKRTFSLITEKSEGQENKQKDLIEFRNDVCSFANSSGGYIIYGVIENDSVPHEFYGIDLSKIGIDKFERNVNNWLQVIKPRIPSHQFSYIQLDNGTYIIILFIKHDLFSPYFHIEDEKYYRIYKRIGNSKALISYNELKDMFIQSVNLDKEIESFRSERIDYYSSQEDDENNSYSRYLLLHLIPDTFLDRNYNKPLFVLENRGLKLSSIFQSFECNSWSCPMVNGLRYNGTRLNNQCLLYNNGIAEIHYPLFENIAKDGFFESKYLFSRIEETINQYSHILGQVIETQRFFSCISIIGCKGLYTALSIIRNHKSIVDRKRLICGPIEMELVNFPKKVDMNKLIIEYYLSLGIKKYDELRDAIKSEYGIDIQ